MIDNIFELSNGQLQEITASFQQKLEEGLEENNAEIRCLPTYIAPDTTICEGRALVLSLGGTECQAAVAEFGNGKIIAHPDGGRSKNLSAMKTRNFTREQLFGEIASLIREINPGQGLPVGLCFSFPAESMLNGDARLIHWTKGVNSKEMVGQPIGEPLVSYLNEHLGTGFSTVRVINNSIASLFAGLTYSGYDAYIGLIVDAGSNMSAFIPRKHFRKSDHHFKSAELVPVNLESGNFFPPHLTYMDNLVDEMSDNRNKQRFEKAVSGMYMSELFKAVFPYDYQKDGLDTEELLRMAGHPEAYKKEYADVAGWILRRSARLVAASLAGLIGVLCQYDDTIQTVCLIAEGCIVRSRISPDGYYSEQVLDEVHRLLRKSGYDKVRVEVKHKKNICLTGTAIAALS